MIKKSDKQGKGKMKETVQWVSDNSDELAEIIGSLYSGYKNAKPGLKSKKKWGDKAILVFTEMSKEIKKKAKGVK